MNNIQEANKYKALGNECFADQRYMEAVKHFTKAIDLNPDDHIFYSNRSACYASLAEYDKALVDAQICVDLNPNWAKGYLRRGLAEFYLKKYDDAIRTYTKGLELEPTSQQLIEGLQRVREMKSKQPPEGQSETSEKEKENFFQKAMNELQHDPETKEYFQDPEFVKKLGEIKKNPQSAKNYMNDPKIQKAFTILMTKFGSKGAGASKGPGQGHAGTPPSYGGQSEKMEEEPPVYEKKSQERPEPHPTKNFEEQRKTSSGNPAEEEKSLGNEEYKKRNFEKAIYHYDRAAELNPNEPVYHTNKAIVFLEMKESERAIESCDKAIEICKSSSHYDYTKLAKAYAKKASAYMLKHNFDEAIGFYKESLLENQDPKVKEELKKVENLKKETETKNYINPTIAEEHRVKGNDFFNQGKFPEAIKEYEEAIKRDPSQARLYANLGTALMKMIEYPTALNHFNKCLELDPNYVKAYAKKGSIYFVLKEYHKALEAYERGLKLEPTNEECKTGIEKTNMAILVGSSSETPEERSKRAERAMSDPEIQAILQDPSIAQILRNLQERPHDQTNMAALRDPEISRKINKLIAAGILGTS